MPSEHDCPTVHCSRKENVFLTWLDTSNSQANNSRSYAWKTGGKTFPFSSLFLFMTTYFTAQWICKVICCFTFESKKMTALKDGLPYVPDIGLRTEIPNEKTEVYIFGQIWRLNFYSQNVSGGCQTDMEWTWPHLAQSLLKQRRLRRTWRRRPLQLL